MKLHNVTYFIPKISMFRRRYIVLYSFTGILIFSAILNWTQLSNIIVVPDPVQHVQRQMCRGNKATKRGETELSRWPDKDECPSNRNIVYIKVHKAASSTMNQILLRYGLERNKIVALPKWWHYFDFSKHFHRNMALGYEHFRGKSELLINHARLHRPEMDAVVENAVYVASLRHPAAQLESAFGFFDLGRYLKKNGDQDPLEVFMSDPGYYSTQINFKGGSLRNQQIFDLGLDPEYFEDLCAVEWKIQSLSEQLDLVLISEFFDESLILMKYLLCLDFKDILYIHANVRSNKHRTALSKTTYDNIEKWNAADMLLYSNFNRTLWRRIAQFGEEFTTDLKTFKDLKANITNECIAYTDRNVDQRLWKIRLKHHATQFCKNLTRSTVPTIKSMRSEMISKYGSILDKVIDNFIVWREDIVNRWKT
ncbi:galactosylceramide sulfotransferase-like [Amphiura filiformis]|uniref:galactosylceramide sulfotransferase-like n=1 Tax=Amphiura filiformis TaxID=82378 RepID=UPI003B2190DA